MAQAGPQAQQGDTVRVHYTGKFDDETVFDSSDGRDPLEFTLGQGQVIPGLEQAVVGMAPGDTKTATIPMDDAYGPHQAEMVMNVDRGDLPPNIDPQVGQQLQSRLQDGQVIVLTVTDVTEAAVTLDANHPLAGKDLVFDIELVEIA
ncbi:MAG: peptidylprolyl isomerase [Phycisphaerae bacterium]|nr:peptidylprolyl isomerase [Phycisphaerae bacterium]